LKSNFHLLGSAGYTYYMSAMYNYYLDLVRNTGQKVKFPE